VCVGSEEVGRCGLACSAESSRGYMHQKKTNLNVTTGQRADDHFFSKLLLQVVGLSVPGEPLGSGPESESGAASKAGAVARPAHLLFRVAASAAAS